jgi:D-arabinose 1-dehydrogenase-like Zn-dependent alcohol dehydrogenase
MTPIGIVPQVNEERIHSTMMAWRVHEFGPPEVMKFERVPWPEPGPGEVLVKVEAAGVGPWDGWIRAGKSALPQPLPLTLGSDLSGVIVATGPGVSGLRVGDQIYGVTNRASRRGLPTGSGRKTNSPSASIYKPPRDWLRVAESGFSRSRLAHALAAPVFLARR